MVCSTVVALKSRFKYDDSLDAFVEAIGHTARTGDSGQVGDGKILVLDLRDCVRIRTGERGGMAIGP